MEDVEQMQAAGETEIAIDELRWLLGGCPDFVEAHAKLGELALAEDDLALARAHLGNAFRIGTQTLRRAGATGPLPYRLKSNQAFHSAGKGLVWCLFRLGKHEMAREVAEQLLALDPTDPLAVRQLMANPPEAKSRRTKPDRGQTGD